MTFRTQDRLFPDLGMGLGLRPEHYRDVLAGKTRAAWFEVVSENFMLDGGRPISVLEQVRRDYPVVLHGVSLSIGSTDPLDKKYLTRLKGLADLIEPAMVSDHACWTGVNGENLHDLLPLPYTEEAIRHVAARVSKVQDVLGRRIMLENVSSYLTYAHSEMEEWDFLAEIARRADCGILLDVNNVYVSAVNHGFDPITFLEGIPLERVGQFHLAGHSTNELENGRKFLVDTHDHPVCDEVWELLERAVERFGPVPTMIERDANIPALAELENELSVAERIRSRALARDTGTRPTQPRERPAPLHASI
jgi:uncharacterized protein (UPF0276 family)